MASAAVCAIDELAWQNNRRQFAVETLALYHSLVIADSIAILDILTIDLRNSERPRSMLRDMALSVVDYRAENEARFRVEQAVYQTIRGSLKKAAKNAENDATSPLSVEKMMLVLFRSLIANYATIVSIIDESLKDSDIVLLEKSSVVGLCRRPIDFEAAEPDELKKMNPTWRLWYRVKLERLISLATTNASSAPTTTSVTDAPVVESDDEKLCREHRALMEKCGDYDDYLHLFESQFKNEELSEQFVANSSSNGKNQMVFALVKIMNEYCHARLDSAEDRLAIDNQLINQLVSRFDQLLLKPITPELEQVKQ